jgi:flagellar M-ring protein FliF
MILGQIRAIWGRLSGTQRVSLGAGFTLILVLGAALAAWSARPRLELLYGGLQSEDAARIVDELRSENIRYGLRDGGSTILVPRRDVYDVRLKLASMGIPRQGSVGYEIFDQNTLGMTDFVQRLNYQRALEGELTRTLEQLAEVERARIHVVMPEPSLFLEEARRPSASVVLSVVRGRQLGAHEVQGVRHLVASSVEGLQPEDVTIVDASGNILTRETGEGGGAVSGDRLELKRSVESYLSSKARAMLEGVLGPQNALVQVDVDLDFDRVERTIETYDSENPVVRSEERSQTGGQDGSQGQSTVTNYEISRTVQKVVGGVANVKQLSVAVLVDGIYDEEAGADGETVRVYRPRPAEELERLAAIIENAVGALPSRGDRVTVENFAFDRRLLEQEAEERSQQERTQLIMQVANKVGVGLLVILLLILARGFAREVRRILVSPPATPEETAELTGVETDEYAALQKRSQILTLAQEDPQKMAQLVRAWMADKN